jgi:adenosylmethionine-8-amino-7-oxononanoate aminotransferase
VLLCADEVIGGFGRTGEWFAHEYFGFEPDTLSIAKGLTSGYIPMGGLVLSKKMARVLVEQGGVFAHGLTYSGTRWRRRWRSPTSRRCAMKGW